MQGDLITISNADLVGETLPNIRRKIYVNPNRGAVLRYGDVMVVDCPKLGEAVTAWLRLGAAEKYTATISGQDGEVYTGAEIEMLYPKTGMVSMSSQLAPTAPPTESVECANTRRKRELKITAGVISAVVIVGCLAIVALPFLWTPPPP